MRSLARSFASASLALLTLPAAASSQSQLFTVSLGSRPTPGCQPISPNDVRFALGILELGDTGRVRVPAMLDSVAECITRARGNNRDNGVIVVVFVHGWRHNADWNLARDKGDDNIRAFRDVLQALSLREAERYYGGARGRTVIGVYIGWNGGSILDFSEPYERALRIGRSPGLRAVIARLLKATKNTGFDAPATVDSPMILAGHSMGGLILQSVIAASLDNRSELALWKTPAGGTRCTRVLADDHESAFPDLVLLLNPATTAQSALDLRSRLDSGRVRRMVACDPARAEFAAPVIISVASESDWALKHVFRLRVGQRAEGHDEGTTSHRIAAIGEFICDPLPLDRVAQSFGQPWHCVRAPLIAGGWLQEVEVDLPHPNAASDERCHVRFRVQRAGGAPPTSYWVIRIPKPVVDGHGDIYNARSNSLFMSFAQLSGALLSIHMDWPNTFERDPQQACTVRPK